MSAHRDFKVSVDMLARGRFGLLSSVTYVSALSLWALVSGHWSAWQASRVEVEQMAEVEQLEANPIEERVVEKLVEATNIELAGPGSARSAAAS